MGSGVARDWSFSIVQFMVLIEVTKNHIVINHFKYRVESTPVSNIEDAFYLMPIIIKFHRNLLIKSYIRQKEWIIYEVVMIVRLHR